VEEQQKPPTLSVVKAKYPPEETAVLTASVLIPLATPLVLILKPKAAASLSAVKDGEPS